MTAREARARHRSGDPCGLPTLEATEPEWIMGAGDVASPAGAVGGGEPDAQLARRRTLRFRPPAHYGVGTRQREVAMRARRFWAALGSLALVAGVAAPSSAARRPARCRSRPRWRPSVTRSRSPTTSSRCCAADPTYSWSTGTSGGELAVHAARGARRDPRPSRRPTTRSRGRRSATWPPRLARWRPGHGAGDVLMGANDACTSTEAGMTQRRGLPAPGRTAALAALASKGVDQIVVASIPDIYKLWEVGSQVLVGAVRLGALQDLPVDAEEPHVQAQGRRDRRRQSP